MASARVIRPAPSRDWDGTATPNIVHTAEFGFFFVLAGGLSLKLMVGELQPLRIGDAFVVPAGMAFRWMCCDAEMQVLEVAVPAPGTSGGPGGWLRPVARSGVS